MNRLHINPPSGSGRNGYDILVGRDLSAPLQAFLSDHEEWRRLALVADDLVMGLHGDRLVASLGQSGLDVTPFSFPAGERSKTRETKAEIEDQMLQAGLGRDAAVLALGGGVTIDLAGFIAATYMRGLPFVALPTSLLAMVDSSIGGKTAVDTPQGKNLIGAFHPPAAVFSDLLWLDSLPLDQLRWGLAEAVKHGLIDSPDHLAYLEGHARQLLARESDKMEKALCDSIRVKAKFVTADEREAGARKALNFGHTFAHALERLSGWTLPHGEAVARGLVAETDLSVHLGLLDAKGAGRVRQTLLSLGLPSEPFQDLPEDFQPAPGGRLEAEDYLAATRADKKVRAGRVEYVLLQAIGSVARQASRPRSWARPVEDHVIRELFFQEP